MPFGSRFGLLGDTAEGFFERIWPENWERFGLNRPQLNMGMLPSRIRHMPDYVTSKNLIEVKGIGKDDTVKLKVEEWNCAHFWNQVHPLRIFIWSSHRFAWAVADVKDIQRMIDTGNSSLGQYHDDRAYFALPGSLFCWTELDRIDNKELTNAN